MTIQTEIETAAQQQARYCAALISAGRTADYLIGAGFDDEAITAATGAQAAQPMTRPGNVEHDNT